MKSSATSSFYWIAILCVLLSNCSGSAEKQAARPMVYEGMPKVDLEEVLGRPDSVGKVQKIYDVNQGIKKSVERWYYPKRTVVFIDDTVKVTNERKDLN